jgi:hypothetical protein
MLKPLTEFGIYIALWNRHTNELQNNINPLAWQKFVSKNQAVFAILSSLQPIRSLEPSVQPLHVLPLDIVCIDRIISIMQCNRQ